MKWVCSAAQARALDRFVIKTIGVPGVALMELASRAVATHIQKQYAAAAQQGVVVVCGGGNNGGDGYGCARWLHLLGFPVSTLSRSDSLTGDALTMRNACQRAGVPEVTELGAPGLIVDALLGTGLSRAVDGELAALVEAINQCSCIVAVDIPSGLCANTGAVLGIAVRATSTVTFGCYKRGFFGEPGADCVGDVVVADIGLGAASVPMEVGVLEADDIDEMWPRRAGSDHKGKSGHLVVVAGSTPMAGAAVLACHAALRSGVGLVTLVCPRGIYPRLERLDPAVMVVFGGEHEYVEGVPSAVLEKADAVVCGPGLGGGAPLQSGLQRTLQDMWRTSSKPMLFDADSLVAMVDAPGGPRVITPHPGEAARLLGSDSATIQADRFKALQALTKWGATVVLKGRNSLVGDGVLTSINPTGGPVLATAGSGDVLCGVIGALLARGVDCSESARLGVYVHGSAGDVLAEVRSQGWSASDIVEAIPRALERLRLNQRG